MMTEAMADLKPIMTTREVSESLGIKTYDVKRLVEEGVLTPLRGYRRPFKFSGVQISKWLKGE